MSFPKVVQFDIRLSLKVFTSNEPEQAQKEAINQLMEKLQMSESQAILIIKEGGIGSLNQTGIWLGKYKNGNK